MMVPEGILLLLFVTVTSSFADSVKVQIKVLEKTETTKEGSSVTIHCFYLNIDDNMKLLWFKDSNYDQKSQMFNGTIVYSNSEERPQSPDYSNRVEYITDFTSQTPKNNWIQCDLRITDLQKTDSGNYSFRFIGSEPNKYMSETMALIVTDNPCKVHVEPSEQKNPLKEFEEFTVNCSTFGPCSDYPQWLIYTSGQKQERMSEERFSLTDMITEKEEGRKVTELKLNVTWKDDKSILSCRPAQDKDSCQIRNITLSVEYAPKETTAKVSSEEVKEGDSVTLSCTSRGHPNVTFSWFKKEKMEESQQMSDLTLNNVKQEDSGNYYCEAKNMHGAMKSNIIIIDVKYGPKGVTVKPLAQDLIEGNELKLECSVNKSNPLVMQFTWWYNSMVLPQTSKTLTINNVTADNAGTYYCQANNGINTGTSIEVSVSVKYSPRYISIHGKNSVKVNSRLTLTCSADANPKPVLYTWMHTPGLFSFPSPSQTGELNIDNVTIQHAGQFTCKATNTIGSRSFASNVDVLYPPSKLSLIMKSKVREFEVFSIFCTVQSFPMSTLTVTGPQYDLRNIQNNRGNITKSENKLTVYLNVTESQAGRYKCKAENSEGKLETEQELTVLYAPKNVTASSKGEQTFGSELTLTCEARSKPPPSSYEWMKSFNGQLKTVGHEQKLHFHSLHISDSGQFFCIVKNSIGKTKSQLVDIRVKYSPNINIVHNMTAEWNWELAVYLTCSADAYPPATAYTWYREEDNTTVLSDQQNFTVLPQNPGTYYCTATNKIGKSRSKDIMLFVSSNYLKVLGQIILPIILLLILISVAIFLIRRTIIKGSQNNTRENLTMEDIPDPFHGRIDQSHPTPHSQDPTRAQYLNPRPKSNIHTVYSAIKLPRMKQGECSPKPQKPGYMDNDLYASTLNYVTLDFKGQNEPKRAPEYSAVYAMESKNKQPKNSQSEHPDYENVSSACASRLPFNNIDWESDTSEEDEVNYSTVSCSAKPAGKEPKHNQRSCSNSSSDDEDRTEYSAIKT